MSKPLDLLENWNADNDNGRDSPVLILGVAHFGNTATALRDRATPTILNARLV